MWWAFAKVIWLRGWIEGSPTGARREKKSLELVHSIQLQERSHRLASGTGNIKTRNCLLDIESLVRECYTVEEELVLALSLDCLARSFWRALKSLKA